MKKASASWIVVLLMGGLIWILSHPTEPLYQGKPLNAWLTNLYYWGGGTNNPAYAAVREMGTNAIPALLQIIQSGDPPFHALRSELNRIQSLVHLPVRDPRPERRAASYALYAMGANAKPAFPVLTNLLFHTNSLHEGVVPAIALAGMGSEGLPPLLAALTNQNALLRELTASGLGWARSDMNIVVPALIGRLKDQDPDVHNAAVVALGRLHAEPDLAVPALIKDFPANDPFLGGQILWALGRFETNASAAVPMLIEALSDNDWKVRHQAASALKQIDPAAAAKAGVK
jgi:HEAT repeat protein